MCVGGGVTGSRIRKKTRREKKEALKKWGRYLNTCDMEVGRRCGVCMRMTPTDS